MQMTKKITSVVLAVLMVVSMMVVGAVSASAASVAQNTTTGTSYDTLKEAIDNAADGETIKLLADCAGNGIKVSEGKFTNGLTVDFDGHTYTVNGTTVGSTGTETQGFQLLKNNKITFKNGKITGNSNVTTTLKFLIQNYSDLTLDNMELSLVGRYYGQYTLSNNNGDILIKDSTISAPTYGGGVDASEVGSYAFDVCRYSNYPSVKVTVQNSTINGSVEVTATGGDVKDGLTLDFQSGTLNGEIVDDEAPAAATVTQAAIVTQNVAKIGNTYYPTFVAAFAAAQDGDTIDVIADSTGGGIKAPQGKFNTNGLKVDFHEHTYTVDKDLVGSTGTQSQAFQLLKDNKITLQYGTITSENARMLIQNYSDLTLKNMTLTPKNTEYPGTYYTLSNNNGNTVINNTTINSNPTAGSIAFDVCRYSSYPSVSVTVKGDSVINGDVEVSASGNDAKDGFSLTLEKGTLNGDIVLDPSAEAAMASTPAKATVEKKATFTQAAPEGYKWVDDGAGKEALVKMGLQEHADELDAEALTGLSFVDGTSAAAPVEAHKANLLGVQLRTGADLDYADEGDGTKDLRFVAAIDKQFLASLGADAKYGFEVKAEGSNYDPRFLDCTGTLNNVISSGASDKYEYVTLAIYNINDTAKNVNVKFVIKDGNDTANAYYKATAVSGSPYVLRTNYEDVASHLLP